jgi:predicted secreted hydrolase
MPWEYVVTSNTSADLTMGSNTIVVSEGIYTIQGVAFTEQGNQVMWNLQYIPDKPSLDGYRNLKLSRSNPNQEMSWYVQIPSATVYGALVVDGVPIPINGRGYHDHNWGTWKLYYGLWNWFQTNNPKMTIVGYDFYTMRKSTYSSTTKK